jgi:hypothetical protein
MAMRSLGFRSSINVIVLGGLTLLLVMGVPVLADNLLFPDDESAPPPAPSESAVATSYPCGDLYEALQSGSRPATELFQDFGLSDGRLPVWAATHRAVGMQCLSDDLVGEVMAIILIFRHPAGEVWWLAPGRIEAQEGWESYLELSSGMSGSGTSFSISTLPDAVVAHPGDIAVAGGGGPLVSDELQRLVKNIPSDNKEG